MTPRTNVLETLADAIENRLLDDPLGRRLQLLVQRGIVDDFVVTELERRVARHTEAQLFAGPFSRPRGNRGDFCPGLNEDRQPVLVTFAENQGHAMSLSGSGGGKTIKSYYHCLQILPRVRGAFLFDLQKREFRRLSTLLYRVGVRLVTLPLRRLILNPLQVPLGVSPAEYAPCAADILVQSLKLPPRCSKLIHTEIIKLYHRFGVFQGLRSYPTLFDCRESVKRNSGSNPQARLAFLDSVDPVLLSIGQILMYRQAWSTHELSTHRIAFEFAGGSESDKNLLLTSLVYPEFKSRVSRGISNPGACDLYLNIDEAQRILSGEGSKGIIDLLALVRGSGLFADFSIQSADGIPHAVFSNTANKWIGRCGSARDYESIASAMGLTSDQRQWLKLNARPGTWVVQLAEFRQPWICHIPRITVPTSGHPEDDGHNLDLLASIPTVRATEFEHWSPWPEIDLSVFADTAEPPDTTTAPTHMVVSAKSKENVLPENLSEAELRFLRAVVAQPGKKFSDYIRPARVSARRAREIREHLVEHHLIRVHSLNQGQRGRAAMILEPLPKARSVLDPESRSPKRGEA